MELSGILNLKKLVITMDLNFTMHSYESLVAITSVDFLADFLKDFFKRNYLVDIFLGKITPTWENKRLGEKWIGKRLERFFMLEDLLEKVSRYRSWVLVSNILYHSPIAF